MTPSAAAGTVQFKRNGVVFDTKHVTNGQTVDSLDLNLLLVLEANYQATFTPDNTAAYLPSTSNTLRLP